MIWEANAPIWMSQASHTALDIFGLEGQVPERRVKGEPAEIYTIADYEWY
jgi:hypothetical protein